MKLNQIKLYNPYFRTNEVKKNDAINSCEKVNSTRNCCNFYTQTPSFRGLNGDEYKGDKANKKEKVGLFRKITKFFSKISQARDNKKIMTDMQKHYESRIHPPIFNQDDHLPIIEKYVIPIKDTIKNLVSQGSCIVYSDKDIDSNEVFIKNLRTYIDGGLVSHLGFNENRPFIQINLADYIENPQKATESIEKDIESKLDGKEQPILLVKGIRAFFDTIDRPHDFASGSIFKKYPTVFFVEQGYEILDSDEAINFKLGRETREERLQHDNIFFNESQYHQTLSKLTFLRNQPKVELPSLNSDDVYIYLTDEKVQKQLLTNGIDIGFSEEAIPFAIMLSKAMKYYEDDFYNARSQQRVLGTNTIPFNKTINLLRSAIVKKLIQNRMATEVCDRDIINSIPKEIDWKHMLEKFNVLHNNIIQSNLMLAQKLKEQSELPKIEVSSGPILDSPSNKQEIPNPPKEEPPTEENKETGVKTEDNNNVNYEIVKNVKTKFSDVGGLFNIKKELKEDFLDILNNPRIKKSDIPSGILLSGPPGCGKTLLARAIAGEAKVPFITMPGSSFIEMYVGVGAKRVRDLYAVAKKEAKNHPSKTAIVFIDEVDTVAGNRTNNGTSEDTKTVTALLHEMDGVNNKEENDVKIITIVATNHKGMIDDAFKRSGRIDLKYDIPDPKLSVKAREEILKIHAKDLPFKDKQTKEKILHNLALTTSGMSGADLAELLKKAHRMSLNINRKKNIITPDDIQEAKMRVLSGSKTDIEHTEFEIKQTFAHEAGHAVNLMIMEKIFKDEKNKHKMPVRVLDFISNSARGSALGTTYMKPSEENKMMSKETCLADVITFYGGYAIESEMFDTHSSGVSSDLQYATDIIESAVVNYDFGGEKRFLSLNTNLAKNLFQDEIKRDMLDFSNKGMEISKKLIKFAKPFIENYLKEYFSNGLNLDKIITAKEFKEKFDKWLNKNHKRKEYEELCREVKTEITEFCDEKSRNRVPIGFSLK